MPDSASLIVNGCNYPLGGEHLRPLSSLLRDDLGLKGTKVGCSQGDCGSCSVILNDAIACACLVPLGQLCGSTVVTVEGLPSYSPLAEKLIDAFKANQAVQCGFCTPGFLVTAVDLLMQRINLTDEEIEQALGGVLCRCTGYQKIFASVKSVSQSLDQEADRAIPAVGAAVGTAVTRLDIAGRLNGTLPFGADGIPSNAYMIKAIRSPFHHASFQIGNIDAFMRANPDIVKVLTASDLPGRNLHGVASSYADQPVFAVKETRHRLEAVAAVVGRRDAIERFDEKTFPVTWTDLGGQIEMYESLKLGAKLLHENRPGNILIRGFVEKGDANAELLASSHVVEGTFTTSFVEHGYIEPEAGWAYLEDGMVVVHSCTQAPHAHRSDLAEILDLPAEKVRVIATAVGGGFGGKLDLTVQPYLALAALLLDHPVGMIYTREESIATSTKRHPARLRSRIGATAEGMITGIEFEGDFNTGAYASWGTAVANRVPVHACGPYRVAGYRATTRAIHTHVTPAGAFRGFGVPQTAIAQEQLIDALADRLGIDALNFRRQNALRPGDTIPTGQMLEDSVGIIQCLDALQPHWRLSRASAEHFNKNNSAQKRGVGVAAMFYGCGNTAMSNPSTIRFGIRPDGRAVLHQGAVDAGQGSNTVIPQIAADALGIALPDLLWVGADTHITPDAGRTSASRQTFVSGAAAKAAGMALREQILRMGNAGPCARILFGSGSLRIQDGEVVRTLDLMSLPANKYGYVLMSEETFDPPSTFLDQNGQGSPYAVYAFGAQLAEVEIDCELGLVKVLKVTAAHDVGRIVNPTLLEGQIEGAVAQGVGMALMENFIPGRTENLHDYLVPGIRDMPAVESIFIEEHAAIGPYGAKGIGEPALVPTVAAILNAIKHVTGKMIHTVPVRPEQILRDLGNMSGMSGF